MKKTFSPRTRSYILSSGVRKDHVEFGLPDGGPGSRVLGLWGWNNSDPLGDCPDAARYYGRGTFAASLAAGRRVGVAKNATIWSGACG